MASAKISPARDAGKVAALLDSPEIAGLVAQLEATRWTGRPGYPVRSLVGLALVKSLAGSDSKRKLAKWRCPALECIPASVWRKASRLHPLIPRETERWKALYRQRPAIERTFGRLKHDWGMLPLRVRRIARVALHINLSILTHLASALLALRT